jgi:hypothetical protein
MSETPSLSPQDALVAVMVAVSAADEQMRTAEMVAIQRMVNHMPVFAGYDPDRIRRVSQTVFDLFEDEDGLSALFGLIRDSLPKRLCPGLRRRHLGWQTQRGRNPHAGRGPRRTGHRPLACRRHRVGNKGAEYDGVRGGVYIHTPHYVSHGRSKPRASWSNCVLQLSIC